jgi:hypothetical protein
MNADDATDSSTEASGFETTEAESNGAPKSNGCKFGPTEYSIVPTSPEDWTPTQRVAAMVIGATAMLVGICGLLGIRIEPRDRY